MSELISERWLRLAFAKDSTTTILNEKKDPYDSCWDGYERVPGTKKGEKGSCRKKTNETDDHHNGDHGADEINETEEVSEVNEGLWDNIRKKRARGERPARKGEKGYPSERSWRESTNEAASLEETDELAETDEGNAFSGARQDAIDAGEDEFEVDGKKYKVTGDKSKTNEQHQMSESELRTIIRKCILEACYDGRKVTLNKKMSNPENKNKKSKVYVAGKGKYKSGPCKGQNKAKKVQFGDPNMRIKKNNPKNRKSFRARHNCDNPGPKDKARYWSCKSW